jgi:glucose/arabinose dehydrogenase
MKRYIIRLIKSFYLLIGLSLLACTTYNGPGPRTNTNNNSADLSYIKLPDGFSISLFADHVNNARQMTLADNEVVFVGSVSAGNVYAIPYDTTNYAAKRVITIASGLNMPNGVAFRDGNLYVAEVDKIIRYDNILQHLDNPPEPKVINDQYPSDRHHGAKYIKFGPDGKLYVPEGVPCNICKPDRDIYGTITRMNADGTGMEIIERGIRNTVGFDWNPATKVLWFTDNGRDLLGDNSPPDELNRAPKVGLHFGYPYLHGKNTWDPKYGNEGKNMNITFTTPAQELGPHVASLGMIFYTGRMFPKEYQNNILIAEHGSWNRSEKIGYRVTIVTLDGDNITSSYKPFAEGWLQPNSAVLGRPVALLQLPDGSVLVSDDYSDRIYRITYSDL